MFIYGNQNKEYRKVAKIVEVVYWIATVTVFVSLITREITPSDEVIGGIGAMVLLLTIYMRYSINKLETTYMQYSDRYKLIAKSLKKLNINNKVLDSLNKEEIKIIEETIKDEGNIGDWSFNKDA